MSGRTPELAAGLTRGWVRLYTGGLPSDLRLARRAELESDLWEHVQWRASGGRRPGRTALEIVARLVAGIAADLSWRHEHRASRRSTTHPLGGGTMTRLLKQHGMTALTVTVGVWATAAVPILIALDDSAPDGAQQLVSFGLGLLILGGLIAMRRGLRGGRTAVALGSIGTGLIAAWLVIPPVAAIVILVWLYAPRRLRRTPAQPA